MKHISPVLLAGFAVAIAAGHARAAQKVSGSELRAMIVGKKLQDVARADHWIRPAAGGTGGRELVFTNEDGSPASRMRIE